MSCWLFHTWQYDPTVREEIVAIGDYPRDHLRRYQTMKCAWCGKCKERVISCEEMSGDYDVRQAVRARVKTQAALNQSADMLDKLTRETNDS